MATCKVKHKKNDVFCIFAVVVILFTSWTVYYALPFSLAFEAFLALSIIVLFGVKSSPTKRKLFLLFFLISLWYFWPMGFDLNGILLGLFRSFVISSLFLLPNDILSKIFQYLKLLLAAIVCFGVIAHVLRLLDIFSFPMIDYVFRDNRYYEVYPLLVYQNNTSMRFASIFDEPGYLGTLSGLFLAIEGFNLKKISNVVLFVGGLISLSFAFYVMAAISLVSIALRQRKYSIIIAGVLLVVGIYFALPDFFTPIIERPEILSIGTGDFTDSRGGVVGIKSNLKIISDYGFFGSLFGNGYDAPLYYFKENTNSIASSSIFRLIFQMGYLGLLALVLFIISHKGKGFCAGLFTALFILSLYQRPHIFELIFVLLLAYSFSIQYIQEDESAICI